jgi:PAB1-binding protein PBP1
MDGLSPEQGCEKTLNGMENSETWCGKTKTRCYVVQAMYLEKLEMTMGKMEIGKRKLVIVSPSYLEEKQDVYIGSEKSDTTIFDKLSVNNKKMIIDNHYDEPLTRIDYENGVMKNQWNWHYQE